MNNSSFESTLSLSHQADYAFDIETKGENW